MQHRVAVWTYWHKVFSRIHDIFFRDVAYRDDVMDVDKSLTEVAISLTKVNSARLAHCSVILNTRVARLPVALIAIHHDLNPESFLINRVRHVLIGKDRRELTVFQVEH